MKNLIHEYFDTVYTLEAFLYAINLKLPGDEEKERLRSCLRKGLSHILIAFDFDMKSTYKSYIDRKLSYEQLIYLIYYRVNESPFFAAHMFRSSQPLSAHIKDVNAHMAMSPRDLEQRLVSTENLSVCYFFSKSSSYTTDGIYWRELFELVGSSIMKYILTYACLFRKIQNNENVYIQVGGLKFNLIGRGLVSKKLEQDEKQMRDKKQRKFEQLAIESKPEPVPKNLMAVFNAVDEKYKQNIQNKYDIDKQLSSMGHRKLDKTSMLYNRCLHTRLSPKLVYSDHRFKISDESVACAMAEKIVVDSIFKDIVFDFYPDQQDIETMMIKLRGLIFEFIILHRSCPYYIFLCYHCKSQNKNNCQHKRRRDQEEPQLINETNNLKKYIEAKQVYCFIRRCMMYILGYDENKLKAHRIDKTCQLIGGWHNLKILLKQTKKLLGSLKYDSFSINEFAHGIKLARIPYLASIKCHKYKRLVLLAVIRWLLEDYVFMIIKANFYITDTSKTNFELFYYLKSDWRQIVKEQLSEKNYNLVYNLEKINSADLISYCSRFESNGMHLGRLLPKNVNNECRVISGCRVYNPCTKKGFSINYRFITLNGCLKWLIQHNPHLIGFGCSSQKDIHTKYSEFLSLNTMNRTGRDGEKKWSFVKFDLTKCFDSINSKELIKYVSELFQRELAGNDFVFSLMRICKIKYEFDERHLMFKYEHVTMRHRYHEKGFPNGIMDYIQMIESSVRFKNRGDCLVLVPLGIHEKGVTARKLADMAKKCVEHVVIKIHNELYERMNGILQGSICSRNLCDLYFGRFENELFSFDKESNSQTTKLVKSDELILRNVDDYLIIGCNPDRLVQIGLVIRNRFNVNEKKTVMYLSNNEDDLTKSQNQILIATSNQLAYMEFKREMKQEIEDSAAAATVDSDLSPIPRSISFLSNCSHVHFAWCGFNFDTRTLDVYLNYEKYFEAGSFRSRINNLNVDSRCNSLLAFNLKFLRLYGLNLTSLMMDGVRVNNLQAIIRKFVDFFALSALRFFAMSDMNLMPDLISQNVTQQLRIILNLCHFSTRRLSVKLKQDLSDYFYSVFSLFKFLCLKTYSILIVHFRRKRQFHLLRVITASLRKLHFIRCIKFNSTEYYIELVALIYQQLDKFYQCRL